MRRWMLGSLVAVALAAPGQAHDAAHNPRLMVFPATADGGMILPVDLHTHSVFSDGSVWPDIRVEEAKRDGLAALAVTEHLEYQPHAADIPHPDRNRSFQLATEAAKTDLLVINGAEITRDMPPGHINAVFITDANALKVDDVEAALRAANAQGGFVFWNHPYWHRQAPDGVARLMPLHERLIAAKLLHGVEVANGEDYSESALKIALDNNLAILGASDIHGLVDWDFDVARGGHRAVTLALTKSRTAPAIRDALRAGRTVAWFKQTLIGKPAHVEEVVRASLTLETGTMAENSRVLIVKLKNASPVRYTLRLKPPQTFYTTGDVVTVPPNGAIELQLTGGVTPASAGLDIEVLNSIVAPKQTLSLTLRPKR
jgi:3',5'-nucleoside bisphosphate phosphatase